MSNEYCLDRLVRMKTRRIGLRALQSARTAATTSGMKKKVGKRSGNMREPIKNGKNPEIPLLIYPHMYVPTLAL